MLTMAPNLNMVLAAGEPWDLSGASYDGVSLDTSLQISSLAVGLHVGDGGTKFYVDSIGDETVFQYNLSTAWDLSTASYSGNSFSHTAQTFGGQIALKDDGTKLYVGDPSSDEIFQYSLSTAWDVSTASYDSKSLVVGTAGDEPRGIYFKDDGTSVFVTGGDVTEYTLSTAWDVSTGTDSGNDFNVSSNLSQVIFTDSGTRMFLADFGASPDTLRGYTLSPAWDITSATADSTYSGHGGNVRDFWLKDDGTKLYILDFSTLVVKQYNLA